MCGVHVTGVTKDIVESFWYQYCTFNVLKLSAYTTILVQLLNVKICWYRTTSDLLFPVFGYIISKQLHQSKSYWGRLTWDFQLHVHQVQLPAITEIIISILLPVMDVSCQCGTISFKTPLPDPEYVYICHCTECRRQSSSAFGISAMFPKPQISPELLSKLSVYTRRTLSGVDMKCYFCTTCGSRIWHERDGKRLVSIKGGLIEGINLGKAIHIW